MNREIKFQFIIDDKHLSASYTIDELLNISEEKILEDMEVCDCNLNESGNCCEGDCIRFKNSSTTGRREYTGLKDKNIKDIYEGDVVKVTNKAIYNGVKVVVWDKILMCYVLVWAEEFKNWKNSTQSGLTFLKVSSGIKCEIIGNIYENPELIN